MSHANPVRGEGMNCGSCGRANRADSRFCIGCGKPLTPPCPACGVESELDAQFCGACGASLRQVRNSKFEVRTPTGSGDKAEARKVVSIVFADLIGSTALHERL